jgi:hypothetical protein
MCGGNNPTTPTPITIYVSRIGQSNNLSLKQGNTDPGDDTLVTSVDLNQTITWALDPNPDQGRNTAITLMHVKAADSTQPRYQNSQQLLVESEYAAVNGVITGAVVATAQTPRQPGTKPFENYQIGFYANSDPDKTEVWDDPKLIMR